MNGYTYVNNNPLIFVDPSGHCGILPDGSAYSCSDTDTMLLGLKQNYASATTQAAKNSISSYATTYRKDHPDYTVSADESLSDYTFTQDELYALWLGGDEDLYWSLDTDTQESLKYRLKSDIVTNEIKNGFPTVIAGLDLGITMATLGELRTPAPKPQFKLKVDLQLFAAKKDLQMVNDAARQIGVDRNGFGDYIHKLKHEFKMGGKDNFSWDELIQYAKDFKGSK